MNAVLITKPVLLEPCAYRQTLVFSFRDEDGTDHMSAYQFAPNEQATIPFQKGDRVTLHGFYENVDVTDEPVFMIRSIIDGENQS